MQKEVLLYGLINSYSAKQFISDLNNLGSGEKTARINGDGGDVKYGWGVLTKLAQTKDVTIINDGEANSMMAFAFCYPAKAKKCADYATFVFHRAGYSDWFEKDPELFDYAAKAELKQKNDKLRQAMEATMNPVAFMQETNCSLDDLFSMDARREVTIDAQAAKRLGLVDEIIPVTPQRKSQVDALKVEIQAKFNGVQVAATTVHQQNQTNVNMTLSELKAQHPALVQEIITAEKERCETWAVYSDIDPKAVKEGIASGKPVSGPAMAEFTRKQISAEMATKIENENADELKVGAKKEAVKTDGEKKVDAAVQAVRNN